MFPLFLDLQFFIDFKAFWKGFGRVWGGFGEGLGRIWGGFGLDFWLQNDVCGSEWSWDVQKVFGNICLKFWTNVPRCLGVVF